MCYPAEFGRSMSNGTSIIKEIYLKNLIPRVPPFKVTQGYRNRHWSICDFLLTFHSNHAPISYRFRDKRRFQSKIANFSHPEFLTPHRIGYRRLESKWGYRLKKMFGDIFNRLDTIHERDGRTDGQTDTGRQQRPRLITHSVAR